MRFLIYILMIAAAVTFFIYRQETSKPLSSPLTESATPTPLSPVTSHSSLLTQPKPAPVKNIKPTPKPQPLLDQKTLDQIQQKLNQAPLSPASNVVAYDAAFTPRLSQQQLYDKASVRVVNFFCEYGTRVETASGVIISPTGYILTNAHVAENFINQDYECLIRQGSPARNLGYAKIVMFPKAYTQAATRQEQADNDVSIWKFSRPPGESPLPSEFSYYSINTKYYPQANQPLATFSYPAELLGYETLLKNLNLLFAETTVAQFDRDLILSGLGLSSQVGSSGGILVDIYTNELAGLIFGVSKDETINQRKLFSLTPYSIGRVVQAETGLDLSAFLSQ